MLRVVATGVLTAVGTLEALGAEGASGLLLQPTQARARIATDPARAKMRCRMGEDLLEDERGRFINTDRR
jgi:hypothetical protein